MNTSDLLSRQPYLNLLKSIITNQRDNSFGYSFAIDGEWGCGKTWVLNELENQLKKENKYLIFHYNAWENDFYEEPLVAILSVMIEKLNQITSQKSLYGAVIDELLKQVSEYLLTLVSGIVKEVTKIDADEIIKRKKGENGNAFGFSCMSDEGIMVHENRSINTYGKTVFCVGLSGRNVRRDP